MEEEEGEVVDRYQARAEADTVLSKSEDSLPMTMVMEGVGVGGEEEARERMS